jgi:hypothetical protein
MLASAMGSQQEVSMVPYEEVVVIGDYLKVPALEHSNCQARVIAPGHTRSAHLVYMYVKAIVP